MPHASTVQAFSNYHHQQHLTPVPVAAAGVSCHLARTPSSYAAAFPLEGGPWMGSSSLAALELPVWLAS